MKDIAFGAGCSLFCLGLAATACSGSTSPDPAVSSSGAGTSSVQQAGGNASLGGSGVGIGGSPAIGKGGTPGEGGVASSAGGSTVGGANPSGTGGSVGGGAAQAGGAAAGGATATGGVASGNGGTSTGGRTGVAGARNSGGAGVGGKGGSPATGAVPSTGGRNAAGSNATAGGAIASAGAAGQPYRGVANSPCQARTNLTVSWYYNWMQTANEPCSQPGVGGEFVPMVWGHAGAELTSAGITSAVAAMVSRGNRVVLAFNEPDNATQSNVSVANAIALWPAFDNPAIRVGSPATQANTTGVAWYKDFNTQLNANASLRADFIAIHWYGWNAGSCDANAATLEAYIKQIEALPGNRPIWLTEWGCLNNSDSGSATITQAHIAGAVAMFGRHPRLERYAWYPWAGASHSLANADGTLTALGSYYAALPAYR